MPRYFFDTDDGAAPFMDDEGSELPDDQAARHEASRTMAEMAKDHIPSGAPQQHITIRVRDEHGEALVRLDLSFAITPLVTLNQS